MKYHRRIVMNGEVIREGDITNKEWEEIVEKFESRYSGSLSLESRMSWKEDGEEDVALFKQGLTDTSGYIFIKNIVITPWKKEAEILA